MTDRINGFWVAIEPVMRIDDAEPILNAVRCIKGVISVEPHVSNSTDWLAEERAAQELRSRLIDVLYPPGRSGTSPNTSGRGE